MNVNWLLKWLSKVNAVFCVWLLLSLISRSASAKPVSSPDAAPVDLILVLDNSGSMKHNDPGHAMPAAARRFVAAMPRDSQVGVIAFDTRVRVSLPLSSVSGGGFLRSFDMSLHDIDYQGQWTDIPGAIERSVYELREHGRATARRVIVLFTDGFIDLGTVQKTTARTNWLFSSLVAETRRERISIFGVAFTDEADFSLIQKLSQETGGTYYRVPSATQVDEVFQGITRRLSGTRGSVGGGKEVSQTSVVKQSPGIQANRFTLRWVILSAFAVAAALVLVLLLRRSLRPPVPGTLQGGRDRQSYSLGERVFRVGRLRYSGLRANHLVIPEATVGRAHATIRYKKGAFYLEDHGSTNGTFLNNSAIPPYHPRQLKDGDLIRFDAFEYRFGAAPPSFLREAASIKTQPAEINTLKGSAGSLAGQSHAVNPSDLSGPVNTREETCLDCNRVHPSVGMTWWREYRVCKECEASALSLPSALADQHARDMETKQKRRARTAELA